MSRKKVSILIGILIIVLALSYAWNKQVGKAPEPVLCAQDVKLCENGSYVSRQGPNCEFAQCPIGGAPSSSNSKVNQDVIIPVGGTKQVGGLSITFNRLVQESRCPIDAQCIQAGAVNTNVTMKAGSKTETFNMPSDEVPREFAGYKISIINVEPPLRSGQTIKPSDYRITFHVVGK